MKKMIFNLIKNNLGDVALSNYFINSLAKEYSDYQIIELAEKELKSVDYFVQIELENWDYWKVKQQKLIKLIKNIKNELDSI